jgi:lipoyl(octanoyl) transferase
MHGFAINVTGESTRAFAHITPCGLAGVEMTSLSRERGAEIAFEEAVGRAAELFEQRIGQLAEDDTL